MCPCVKEQLTSALKLAQGNRLQKIRKDTAGFKNSVSTAKRPKKASMETENANARGEKI